MEEYQDFSYKINNHEGDEIQFDNAILQIFQKEERNMRAIGLCVHVEESHDLNPG